MPLPVWAAGYDPHCLYRFIACTRHRGYK